MNIDQIKQIVELIIDKHQGRYLSGAEFNLLWRQAELNYQSYLLGSVEQYQPGRPTPRVGLGLSQAVLEKMRRFISFSTQNLALGKLLVPSDMAAVLAVRTSDGKPVRYVEHDRVAAHLNDKIDPLGPTNHIYTPYGFYWQVYPNTTTANFIVEYIRTPFDTKWNYITASGREVYSSSGSIDPLWADTDVMEIIARLCGLIGIPMKDGDVVGFSNKVTQTGE